MTIHLPFASARSIQTYGFEEKAILGESRDSCVIEAIPTVACYQLTAKSAALSAAPWPFCVALSPCVD